MKIALIAPTFPPKVCGVGDHSFFLASTIAELGHEICVYTREPNPIPTPFPVKRFGELDFVQQIQETRPDAVLFQYTPYLYQRSGFTSELEPFFKKMRSVSAAHIVMIAHELHFPIQLSLPGLSIGPLQKFLYHKLSHIADRVVFTYEAPLDKYPNLSNFTWLPVGSNIPVSPAEKISDENPILLHFGGAHPTHLYNYLEASAKRLALKYGPAFHIRCAGISEQELTEWLGHKPANLTALGKLPATEVSRWLQSADLVLAPFMDGISTRRGSAIAAFAHEKAVLTTYGKSTNRSVAWRDFCAGEGFVNAEAFAERTVRMLKDPAALKKMGAAAKEFHDRNFSWKSLAKQILDIAEKI